MTEEHPLTLEDLGLTMADFQQDGTIDPGSLCYTDEDIGDGGFLVTLQFMYPEENGKNQFKE